MNHQQNIRPQLTEVVLQDGNHLEIEIYGDGPALLLPVNPRSLEGAAAEQMRQYGADPALGQNLIRGVSDIMRVIAFDYEGHLRRNPRPTTLTPANVVQDLLTIADAAGADRFAYYGYSWLAMIGLQLAICTDRLTALVIGGFPPLNAPYAEMLRVTTAAYTMAGGTPSADEDWSAAGLSKDETQQYMTLYESLRGFDDAAVQSQITCPRLCFVGSADEIQYGKAWGDVLVSIARPVVREQAQLEALGWDVQVLEGLDHIQAMQPTVVVPMLRPWLMDVLTLS